MTDQQIQTALLEVISKFGPGKIPLHRADYTDQLTPETVQTLLNLPWAFDDSGPLKYAVRRVDQLINLEVWA